MSDKQVRKKDERKLQEADLTREKINKTIRKPNLSEKYKISRKIMKNWNKTRIKITFNQKIVKECNSEITLPTQRKPTIKIQLLHKKNREKLDMNACSGSFNRQHSLKCTSQNSHNSTGK